MKKLLVLVGVISCGGAGPRAVPPRPVTRIVPSAKRSGIALTEAWPRQPDTGDIVARAPAGPFANLSAVCAALGSKERETKDEGCQWSENNDLGSDTDQPAGGPFIRTGGVWVSEPSEDAGVRLAYFALQTRDGWYVLPKLGDVGNRYSSLVVEAERAGGGILLRYQYELATAGRFASDTEDGVIACEVVAGNVACTPKIATREYSQSLETSKPDWPTSTSVRSACTASYANRLITIAPMPKPEGEDETWTAAAAASCAGTRTVRYRSSAASG